MLLRPTKKTLATGLLAVGLLTIAPSPALASRGSDDEATAACQNSSDPDGDSNGGTDKPDCNNGCGNDDDREDDNLGRCVNEAEQDRDQATDDDAEVKVRPTLPVQVEGKVDLTPAPREAAAASATFTATGTTSAPAVAVPADTDPSVSAQATTGDDAAPATATSTSTTTTAGESPSAEVLGTTLTADDSGPSSLPRTGAGIAGLTLAGGLCVGGGRLVSAARRLIGRG